MKQRRHHPKGQDESQTITKAVTHIRLEAVNAGKLAALDDLAQVYLPLCQQYVTLFCTEELPDKFHLTCFVTPLSERWHRVAIQQAAGIAQSWRTNRAQAYQDYVEDLLDYHEHRAEGVLDAEAKEPVWREWDVPTLQQTCIQANVNVVVLEPAQHSTFDYWLKISTLEFRKQLLVPVKLAEYHRKALEGKTINTSVTLNKRDGGWLLTLSYDEVVTVQTASDAQVVGIDVGIANFLTTSTGRHYGSFHGKLRERQKRDREKRRRYEQLSVATMKFKARAQNAYLYASNLAHIPKQIAWNATKRGVQATAVKSAYSSQECSVCHYPDRANRPNQQTFCCQVCGHSTHADLNASINIERRWGDRELCACKDRKAVKGLLMRRHEAWKKQNGWP